MASSMPSTSEIADNSGMYWPSIKRHMLESHGEESYELQCSICPDKMGVFANTTGGETMDVSGPRAHAATVLHCGHIFGYRCINKWLKTEGQCCPACRLTTIYRKCGHMYWAIHFPRNRLLALRMPEVTRDIDKSPDSCRGCFVEDALHDILPEVIASIESTGTECKVGTVFGLSCSIPHDEDVHVGAETWELLEDGYTLLRELDQSEAVRGLVKEKLEELTGMYGHNWHNIRYNHLKVKLNLYAARPGTFDVEPSDSELSDLESVDFGSVDLELSDPQLMDLDSTDSELSDLDSADFQSVELELPDPNSDNESVET